VPIERRTVMSVDHCVSGSDSRDTDYKPTRVSTDENRDSCEVKSRRSDDKEDKIVIPSLWKVWKQPVFVDPEGTGISEDNQDLLSCQSPKWQKQSLLLFVDSGAVMPSSQDNSYTLCCIKDKGVLASSLPDVVWIVESRSDRGNEVLADMGRDKVPPVLLFTGQQQLTLDVL
jgi:hypothetical protein